MIALVVAGIAAHAQDIGVTYAFGKNGVGLLYTQHVCSYIGVVTGFEYSHPKLDTEDFKMWKVCHGFSADIFADRKTDIVLLGTYQQVYDDNSVERLVPDKLHNFSFEVGAFFHPHKRIDMIILIDPLNIEPRIGINVKF